MKNKNKNFYLFGLSFLMISKLYDNRNRAIKKSSAQFEQEFSDYFNLKDKSDRDIICEFAEITVESALGCSLILAMYHTFEQYISLEYGITKKTQSSLTKTLGDKLLDKYQYNIETNSYYEKVEKYRNLSSAIKHNKVTKTFKKNYPDLIDHNSNLGTLLDDSLNIGEEQIHDCYASLFGFAKELIDFLKNQKTGT